MMPTQKNKRDPFDGGARKPVYQSMTKLLCASVSALVLCCTAGHAADAGSTQTQTPIKHLVVIFQENRTFDHYFGTYPNAANISGEQSWIGIPASEFHALPGTPKVNNFITHPDLLLHNPNVGKTGAEANPTRLRPADAYAACSSADYVIDQMSVDGGFMDKFVGVTAADAGGCQSDGSTTMAYYDGNTLTAYWNYAQHYAMSDASFNTNYGPTLPGHLNLVSGDTHGAVLHGGPGGVGTLEVGGGRVYRNPVDGSITVFDNADSFFDDCVPSSERSAGTVEKTGTNVGDLLNTRKITWGWFNGGFAPTERAVLNPDGSTQTPAVCGQSHVAHQFTIDGTTYVVPNPTINPLGDIHTSEVDYNTDGPNIQPFQYYASTANPHHLPPSSVAAIGTTDQAKHQYDILDFFSALKAGNFPAVSFLKAPEYAWGHDGVSDSLVEQAWLVQTINQIMQMPEWESTAIIIAYDDPGGWYDHVVPTVLDPSTTPLDFHCGGTSRGDEARCHLGLRLPFLVISPWAKQNYVDHTVIEQASILRFIEDNWALGFIDGPTAPPPGRGSYDRFAGSIEGMFDFRQKPNLRPILLDPIRGTVAAGQNGD